MIVEPPTSNVDEFADKSSLIGDELNKDSSVFGHSKVPSRDLLSLGTWLLNQFNHCSQLLLSSVAVGSARTFFEKDNLMPVNLKSLLEENFLSLRDLGFSYQDGKVQHSFVSPAGGGRQRASFARQQKLLGWTMAVLSVLNKLYLSSLTPSKHETFLQIPEQLPVTELQRIAVRRLVSHLESYFSTQVEFSEVSAYPTLATLLDRIDLAERYGEKTYKAESLVASKVKLPPKGQAGVVPVEDVLFNVDDWMLNPELLVTDKTVESPRNKVWAEDSEWDAICTAAIESGLFDYVDFNDIFEDSSGKKVFCGAFAVPKDGDAQRFIINVGFNDFINWDKVGEDVRNPRLPYPTSLTLFALRNNEILISNSDDESNCFYLYRLPSIWLRFLAFRKPYRGKMVGLSCVPMGMILSVGIIQKVQRTIASIAGLSTDREIVPDGDFPDARAESSYQIYIDNFDEFMIVSEPDLDETDSFFA